MAVDSGGQPVSDESFSTWAAFRELSWNAFVAFFAKSVTKVSNSTDIKGTYPAFNNVN